MDCSRGAFFFASSSRVCALFLERGRVSIHFFPKSFSSFLTNNHNKKNSKEHTLLRETLTLSLSLSLSLRITERRGREEEEEEEEEDRVSFSIYS
jgi:hypothetical protein